MMIALTETGTTSAVRNQSSAFLLGSAYKMENSGSEGELLVSSRNT